MKKLTLLLLTAYSTVVYSQTDYYWVGGSGNWSDYENHWATESGGSAFHTSAPTENDDVYFDANSFSISGEVMSIDEEAICRSMDWTGVTDFPAISANGNTINIFGSLTLSPDMTANFSTVRFKSTTAGNTIESNGTSMGSESFAIFQGSGEYSLMDDLSVYNLTINSGTFNSNDHNIESTLKIEVSGDNLNLGSSEITTSTWSTGNLSNLDAGTSKIIVSSTFRGDKFDNGPFTYYDVEFPDNGLIENSATFNSIIIHEELELQSGDVFTVNDIIAEGSRHEPIPIYAETVGSEATFSKVTGSIDISYVELKDVHATGGAVFTADNSIDNGNNTGWTINEISSLDFYWVNDGGDWSDFEGHWATTSGGSTMHTTYPSKFDNVYFDENSFSSTGQTVEIDIGGEIGFSGAFFKNMDWTGVTNSPILQSNSNYDLHAYGSVIFAEEMMRNVYNLSFFGNETGLSFDASGSGWLRNITFRGEGTYDLLSDIESNSFSQYSGTVNYNNVSINCQFDFQIGRISSDIPTLNFEITSVNCRDLEQQSTSPVINNASETFTLTRDLIGKGIFLNKVLMDGEGEIIGSNTFDYLEATSGSSVSFEAGKTQTVNQDLILQGTKSNPINLSSTASGSNATISKSNGTVDAIYLVMQDIHATGGATFNASQTIDNGNNDGWSISGITGLDYYWIGGSGTWSDSENHWAKSSGGSEMHTDAPGVLDDVYFDENSFSENDQSVTLDQAANFHDMTWSGITNNPLLEGDQNLNIYGSLTLDPQMTVSSNIGDFYFLSNESETITAGDNLPGLSVYLYFNGDGTWTLQSPLTVREIDHQSGHVDFNGQDVHIDFRMIFSGTDSKTMTLGPSDFYSRIFTVGNGENLTFDASEASMSCSSAFSVLESSGTNSFSFNDLVFLKNEEDNELDGDLTFNKLTFESGTDIVIRSGNTITVNELVAVGTKEEPIAISARTEGSTATISQSTGTVDAYFLELKDISAIGGATFNAFSSINNGNVSGWTFHKMDQTIDFPVILNKVYGDAAFDLSASASSGLPVEYTIISGNVSMENSTVTIEGAGNVEITASQSGDIEYHPAQSVTREFTIAKASLAVIADNKSVTYNDELPELTYQITGYVYDENETVIDELPVISTPASKGSDAGSYDISLSDGSDGNYQFEYTDGTLTILKSDQTLTFDDISDQDLAVTNEVELVASASSGLEVEFTLVEGDGNIESNILTINNAGQFIINADQTGNENYNAATTESRMFQATDSRKTNQTLTFESISDKTYGDVFSLEASASSGLDVLFEVIEGHASIEENEMTITGTASVTVRASQGGNEEFNPAESVNQTFDVSKSELNVTVDNTTIKQGEEIPDFDLLFSGFHFEDNESDLDELPIASTDANQNSPGGTYEITITGGLDDNYELVKTNGILTIENVLSFSNPDLSVYPNPFSGTLKIIGFEGFYKVKMLDIKGRTVLEMETSDQISTNKLSPGVYILKVLNKSGKVLQQKKLIKK